MTVHAVVGGGIAGLAAAESLMARDPEAEVIVFERARRCGGVIATKRTRSGFLLELGPDALVARKPLALAAACSLGLDDELVPGAGVPHRTFVTHDGRLEPLPDGLFAFAPRPEALLRTPLLGLRGLSRMALEGFVPPSLETEDESVADFVTRRFGRELLDALVAPVLSAVHAAPVHLLSAETLLPELRRMEREHGSVVRGLAGRRSRPGHTTGAQLTLRSGMDTLPRRWAARLGAAVRTGLGVRGVARGTRGRFVLELDDDARVYADTVVLAAPAWTSARLLAALDLDLADALASTRAADLVLVSLAYPRERVTHDLEGSGFVRGASDRRATRACTWASRKWPGRAPDSHVLFRSSLEDATSDDRAAIAAARRDLEDLLGVSGEPTLAHVHRLRGAMPVCTVGHLERRRALIERAATLDGIALAGTGLGTVGISDCIESGRAAAEALSA